MLRPPSGFRDITPEEMIIRKTVIERIERVYQRYGFEPIDTPAIEYWDLLKGKYGEEAERKLIYYFKDPWSDKWYALRYDLTVPLARFLANKSYPLPFKRYQIGRVWRHDRPQRARYREFWQADADIVGSPYPEADAEVINLTIDAMKEIGFRDFKVILNDRRLLEEVLKPIVGSANLLDVFRAIDKLDKLGREGVLKELMSLGLDRERAEEVLKAIELKAKPDDFLTEVRTRFQISEETIQFLEELVDLLFEKDKVEMSLSLARGLDYYTGPIWEVKVGGVAFPSVGGGGRYDTLLKIITKRDLPATGTSLGVDRIIDAGKELGIFSVRKTIVDVAIIAVHREVFRFCWELAKRLREAGFNVVVDLMRRKESKQREYAESKGIEVLVFIGRKEVSEGKATIYDRKSSRRFELPLKNLEEELLEYMRERREGTSRNNP